MRLQLCCRSVNLSADDLVLPAIGSVVLRGLWVGALIALVVQSSAQSSGACSVSVVRFLIASLILATLGAVVDLCVCAYASRGTMANPKSRDAATPWIVARYVSAALDVCLSCAVEGLLFSRGVSGIEEIVDWH